MLGHSSHIQKVKPWQADHSLVRRVLKAVYVMPGVLLPVKSVRLGSPAPKNTK